MKETFAIAAALLAVAGNIPYLWEILKGRVKPHPYSWLMWSVISCIIFFGQVQKGAGVGAIPTAASEIFTIIIFLLSLKYGFKHIAKTDTVFLGLALVGIIPWIITKDPTLSVVIAVSIDLVAFAPTVRKTWQYPKTEIPILYGANVLRHILALCSLQSYNIATMLHAFAMLITNSIMVGILVVRRSRRSRRSV